MAIFNGAEISDYFSWHVRLHSTVEAHQIEPWLCYTNNSIYKKNFKRNGMKTCLFVCCFFVLETSLYWVLNGIPSILRLQSIYRFKLNATHNFMNESLALIYSRTWIEWKCRISKKPMIYSFQCDCSRLDTENENVFGFITSYRYTFAMKHHF